MSHEYALQFAAPVADDVLNMLEQSLLCKMDDRCRLLLKNPQSNIDGWHYDVRVKKISDHGLFLEVTFLSPSICAVLRCALSGHDYQLNEF